jgi:hypothetical protein
MDSDRRLTDYESRAHGLSVRGQRKPSRSGFLSPKSSNESTASVVMSSCRRSEHPEGALFIVFVLQHVAVPEIAPRVSFESHDDSCGHQNIRERYVSIPLLVARAEPARW